MVEFICKALRHFKLPEIPAVAGAINCLATSVEEREKAVTIGLDWTVAAGIGLEFDMPLDDVLGMDI